MSHFESGRRLDPHLPIRYAELLSGLTAFEAAVEQAEAAKGDVRASLRGAVREACDRLESRSEAISPPHALHTDPDEADVAFVSGVLRLGHYEDTVLGSLPLVDTCGSKTLSAFEPDVPSSDSHRATLRWALRGTVDLDPTTWQRLDGQLLEELRSLALRKRIMAAIERLHPLQGDQALEGVAHALFLDLMPKAPLRQGEVSLIRCDTGLFFCVPYEDGALTISSGQRSPAEREELRIFLERLAHLDQRYMAHFPSFGFFRGEGANPELLQAIAREAGVDEAEVASNLTTMVVVLPSAKVDQYIVHDAWGHYWQALLFNFEESYRLIADYAAAPDLSWSDLETTLEAMMACDEAGWPAILDSWTEAVSAEACERLDRCLVGLVAEVIADAVEFRFLLRRPDLAVHMPSSSLLKHRPAKLDLTLRDLPFYFEIATKGLRAMGTPAAVEELARGARARSPAAGPSRVRHAVDALASRSVAWVEANLEPSIRFDVGQDVTVNAYGRVALNFLALHTSLNRAFDLVEAAPVAPLKGLQDVLIFATASFYDGAFRRNFWHVDEFVSLMFPQRLARFLAALGRQGPS